MDLGNDTIHLMNKSIFDEDLKDIIAKKELVTLYLENSDDFTVAYILGYNEVYFVCAELVSDGSFYGLSIRSWKKVDLIKRDTLYLKEFVKKVDIERVWQKIQKSFASISCCDFSDWLAKLAKLDKVAGISYLGRSDFAGKIVKHDENILVFDEYYSEYSSKLARTYLKIEDVMKVAIDEPWLETIELAMADKKWATAK